MKFQKPDLFALFVAAPVALLTIAVLAFYFRSQQWPIAAYPFFLLGLLVLAVTFFIARWAAEAFIYSKVKIIFKYIRSKTMGDDEGDHPQEDLERLAKQVAVWAEDRSKEVEILKEREAYRREFVGNVSHELKTPVFNIQGYLLTLLDGAMDDPKINQKFLKDASKNVERMIRIIEDLEVITQIESGVLSMEIRPFELEEVLRDALQATEDKARKRGVKVKLDMTGKIGKVLGDAQRIEQVLINLLGNAIKYNQKEGGSVVLKVQVSGQEIKIAVVDSGLGIGKEHLPHIFERFYRVDRSRSREQGGTGLGLAIVKHILDAHGQTIQVESQPGKGSTFSFALRRA
jgi:two-component system phosphate regulon sensor histidine kinase PhoR